MIDRVRQYMIQHRMLSSGGTVIASISGGPDSIALLHVLHRLSAEFRVKLHVFHVDHGLRGEESEADARFVREFADRLGWDSTIVSLGPDVLRRMHGSLQAAARAVRIRELQSLSARIGSAVVATGHNQNDQAETVLMRLLRGSGVRGLSGVHPVRAVDGLTFIRPLLGVSRQAVEEYCHAHELSPRTDRSNLSQDYLRNRIRLDLIPKLIREYNPALVPTLSSVSEILRDEEAWLGVQAKEAYARCRTAASGIVLSGEAVLAEPVALARRVVRMAFEEAAKEPVDIDLLHVNRVLELMGESGSKELHLPRGVRVICEYGSCSFSVDRDSVHEVATAEWPLSLTETTAIPELNLKVKPRWAYDSDGPWEATFDLDRLPGPLSIRYRRPGDRIWPVGMAGSKKLQDIMVDAKVPVRARGRVPLLVSGDQVLWVIGLRLDRRYLASAGTSTPLTLKMVLLNEPDENGANARGTPD